MIPPARRALADARVFARIGVERFAALSAIEALLAVEAAPEAGEAARAMSDLANRSRRARLGGAAAWMEARWSAASAISAAPRTSPGSRSSCPATS